MADFQGYVILFLTWLISTILIQDTFSIILFLIWLISTILIWATFSKSRARNQLPPSPPALPIIGHLHLFAPIPHQALHKLSSRYGPFMHLFLGSVPCVVASTAEMAKEVLKTHEISFSNRPQRAATDYLTYGSADLTLAPYGPYWKFMKKICMTEVLGRQILDQFLPVRHDEIRRSLRLILRNAESGEPVDVRGKLMTLSNNIISRMTLSQRCSEDEDEAGTVRKLVREMAELGGRFNLSDYFWFCKNLDLQGHGKRLKEVRDMFDMMIERIIKKREDVRRKKKKLGDTGNAVRDVLDILLDILEDESAELRLTRENIKAFIMDLFSGGTDTSAITTEWALAELINHPNLMEKAREEIDSIVGRSRLVEEADIPSLPYLQAIVKETLRLHPAGPLIVRESTKKCTIKDYEIPAKTWLFVNVWAIGRDPKHWENPLEFQPERFVVKEGSGKSQLDVRGQHFHLLPFGSGRRGCPGTSLALQVVQTNLAAMIQCFEWKVGDGGNGAVDMEEGRGVTLPKAHPLICVPVARLNPFPSI